MFLMVFEAVSHSSIFEVKSANITLDNESQSLVDFFPRLEKRWQVYVFSCVNILSKQQTSNKLMTVVTFAHALSVNCCIRCLGLEVKL